MPYDSQSVMWQLSFPMPEEDAKALSSQGAKALKSLSQNTMARSNSANFSGDSRIASFWLSFMTENYSIKNLEKAQITLIGDAAHP
jgi:hypothetical protein